jgi:hypothetical protein
LPLSAVTSYSAIVGRPHDDGEQAFEIQQVEGTYNNSTGLLYWDVVIGATVAIEIKEVGLYKRYLVPDQDTARLGDLTEV